MATAGTVSAVGRGWHPRAGAAIEARARREAGGDEPLGVDRRDDVVSVAVEDDERHVNGGPGRPAVLHRLERRREIVCGPTRKPAVDSCGGVQVRVGPSHDCGHGTARGESSDVDPRLIDGVVVHDLTSDAGENRRLARATLLVAGTEPVPVATIVRGSRLLGIGDDERMLLGQVVHTGAGREIRSVLAATMQHDDERHRLAGITSRNVEVVRPPPGRVSVGEVADFAAGRACRSRRGSRAARPD